MLNPVEIHVMKPSLTKDAIQTMYAWLQGWRIQSEHIGQGDWQVCHEPTWNWRNYNFRIAPEQPKRKIPRTDDDPYK